MRKLGPLEYALYLLEIRDRSTEELRRKMMLKGHEPEEISKVILFLTDKNFLNDERFARNFVKNQLNLKPQGKYQLKLKMKKLFVADDLIETALLDLNEEDEKKQAELAATKWLRVKSKVNPEKKYEKLLRHLVSRGFNYNVAKQITKKLLNC